MTRSFALTAIFYLLFAVCSSPATAGEDPCASLGGVAPGTPIKVGLAGGDVVAVKLIGCDEGKAKLAHPDLGVLEISADRIESVVTLTGAAAEDLMSAVEDVEVAEPELEPSGWTSEVALGFDGATGNTSRSAIRTEAKAEHDSSVGHGLLRGTFRRAEDDSEVSEENATAEARYDWNLGATPWRLFLASRADYDDFKDYDVRWAVQVGPGYQFIDTEVTSLLGRLGVGVSQEVGGDDEQVTPEGLLGVDFEHAFSERHTILSSLEVLPSFDDLGEFRAIGRADWDILLVDGFDLSFRLGVLDRFDSDSGPDTRDNDFEYHGSLVKKF